MRRILIRGLVVLGALLLLGMLAGVVALRASLPALDGRHVAHGLGATATIARDALGAATVSAATRTDLSYALGYAHAQDRWFQMDLLRRASAGELSALLGAGALESDRALRVHRFRAVAHEVVARLDATRRAELAAYAAGVNAGLASLGARPWEYFLLRATPEPWRPEDSVLVVHTMYLQLQEADGHNELQRGYITEALPPAASAFLYSAATEWESAVDGTRSAEPALPTPEEYDLRRLPPQDFAPDDRRSRERPIAGSNNWAVAGSRTASGAAIVANDMHLGLRTPNIWYHARLRVSDAAAPVDVTGVTLPGVPGVVTGSNGQVAWGFTNSYGDWSDVIVLVPDPANPRGYLAPDGPRAYTHAKETIAVHGGAPVVLDVLGTDWGPVIGKDAKGRSLAYLWTAHDPAAVNFEIGALERARSVDEALAIAARAGIPAQNFVTGDAAGHIGWTIAGRIPHRRGGDSRVPRLSTDPTVGWDGWLADAERPRLVDPPGGQIWTANARVVGGDALAVIGDGGYDRGARAGRIAAGLAAAGDHQIPAHSLAVQLDDRAEFLARWQTLMLKLLDDPAVQDRPARAELRDVLRTWSGRAAPDDAAYRLVKLVREEIERRAYYALIAPARTAHPEFRFRRPPSFEGPLWLLVTQQPAHLLPPGHESWNAFLLAALDSAITSASAACPKLAACTWGAVNTTRIQHPLSRALPSLAEWLDMPAEPLPGDADMPRVQGPNFGASERFAVPVGHEADAYFHMPAGQSGHPLSPYYRAGHEAWARGRPGPFLPGAAQHTLTLVP